MSRFVQFCLVFTIAAVLGVGGLVALNIERDTTGVFQALSLKSTTANEYELFLAALGRYPVPHGTREAKALNSNWYRPQTVVIGSSNVWSYVDILDPALKQPDGRPAFNFGLAGISATEIEDVMRHLVAVGGLQQAVLGLEFFMFAGNRGGAGTIDSFPLAHHLGYRLELVGHASRRVLSLSTTVANLKPDYEALVSALFAPAAAEEARASALFTAAAEEVRPSVLDDPQRRETLHVSDRGQVETLFPADRPYRFAGEHGRTTFAMLRDTIALARENRVALRLYLTPHHARHYELIRAIGYGDLYRDWLRGFARVVDEANAGRPCGERIQILDFGSYGPLTTDTAPAPADAGIFRTHPDSIHFGSELSRRVIEATLAASPCGPPPPEAVALEGATIEDYLETVAARRARFAAEHPEQVADVEALVLNMNRPLPSVPAGTP